MRLHQELVLGIGGVRAIRALGLAPAVWHLNEGHSAFLLAERARELRGRGQDPRRGLEHGPPRTPCSRSIPRYRPATSASRRTSCAAWPARSLDAGDVPVERGPRARTRHGRRPRPVRHDRLQPAPDERRERGQQAACGDRERDVERRRRPADPGGHQRHPRADLGRLAGHRAAGRPPRRRPRHARRRSGPGPVLGTPRADSRTPSCGRPTCARSASSRSSSAGGCAAQFARHGEAPVGAGRARRRRSIRPSSRSASPADSRPTSGPACCSATSTGWPASCGTRRGRSRSCSPARPTRPIGPASA